tara:strand:- start:14 stop:292 length:279 start_codon:yes stop_codon:yes gene_type:complete
MEYNKPKLIEVKTSNGLTAFFYTDEYVKFLENELAAISVTRCCTELPIKELPNCNRVEVIDQKGRSYVNWKPNNKVRLSMQDDGRTAKIFID